MIRPVTAMNRIYAHIDLVLTSSIRGTIYHMGYNMDAKGPIILPLTNYSSFIRHRKISRCDNIHITSP